MWVSLDLCAFFMIVGYWIFCRSPPIFCKIEVSSLLLGLFTIKICLWYLSLIEISQPSSPLGYGHLNLKMWVVFISFYLRFFSVKSLCFFWLSYIVVVLEWFSLWFLLRNSSSFHWGFYYDLWMSFLPVIFAIYILLLSYISENHKFQDYNRFFTICIIRSFGYYIQY